MTVNTKKELGQYFTPSCVADFMIGLARIDSTSKILEPSCGDGIFLELLKEKGYSDIVAYEIDEGIGNEHPEIIYSSFVSTADTRRYDLVIGNPPYIRWKNLPEQLKDELRENHLWNTHCNSLCDYLYIFIIKSIEMLKDEGQLIFICPEYWMNTTHAKSLRNYMMTHGDFTEIYHFSESPIFDNVKSSIVIFKYIKGKSSNNKIKVAKYNSTKKPSKEILAGLTTGLPLPDVEYLTVSNFKSGDNWLLVDDETRQLMRRMEKSCAKKYRHDLLSDHEYETIGDVCDIGNGMVSGLDKAFQCPATKLTIAEEQATLHVIKAKNLSPFVAEKTTPYIYVNDVISEDELKQNYPNFHIHLTGYVKELSCRYDYNKELAYWQWAFLRNLKLFSKPERRIFVPCKERISHKDYFRFSLVAEDYFPTQDVTAIFKKDTTKESLEYIVAYLNQKAVFEWLKNNGVVKGNIVEFCEKPIASIPFRKIDWSNDKEVLMHDSITNLVTYYLKTKNKSSLFSISTEFNKLLEYDS